jgi:Flp pilus assembly protein TadD
VTDVIPADSRRSLERIQAHAARLFNEGREAARRDDPFSARDRFAALVFWFPNDLEARNAYALACHQGGDHEQARTQWEQVIARQPGDPLALRGLRMLEEVHHDA